jgi:hypothetical protein
VAENELNEAVPSNDTHSLYMFDFMFEYMSKDKDMFKSTGCTTGRFLMISAPGGRIGGAGHLRRPGNGPDLCRCRS